jgi:hypothetical protein
MIRPGGRFALKTLCAASLLLPLLCRESSRAAQAAEFWVCLHFTDLCPAAWGAPGFLGSAFSSHSDMAIGELSL